VSAPAPTISEAAAARESADEAISKVSETQKRLDDLTEQLKIRPDAEIERLKTELEQQKANPPEQGDLVSLPPGE